METDLLKSKIDREILDLKGHKKGAKDATNKIALFFLGASLIGNIASYFLFFYPIVPIKYNVQPYHVNNDKVRPGDRLSYQSDFCKYTNSQASVVRSLVYEDGRIINQGSPSVSNSSPGCQVVTVISYVIPEDAPEGIAHLEITSTYRYFLFKEVTAKASTETFQIIK